MHIVHVPTRFIESHWGGTETVVLEMCRRLLQMGHESEIVCPHTLSNKTQEDIEGVKITRIPCFYPYFGLSPEARHLLDQDGGHLFSFALLRALQKIPDLDLIHLHTVHLLGGIGRYVARKRRIPYVLSLHAGLLETSCEEENALLASTQGAFEWGRILKWGTGSARVLDDAHAILCIGQEEQRRAQARYPHKKVLHLPNGVDTVRFASGDGRGFRKRHGIGRDAFVLLTVGRIDPSKNQMFLLECLPQLLTMEPEAHSLIIGHVTDEAYYHRLLHTIEAQGLKPHVTLIPGLDPGSQDLVDAFHAGDLFVLPSIHEPYGIGILEAWASGCPVLASRVGDTPSLVRSGHNGILFEANDPVDFFQAFQPLMELPELPGRLAAAGKRMALGPYHWDEISLRLVAVYEEALHEHPFRSGKGRV